MNEYLNVLNAQKCKPSLDFLSTLQFQHLQTIPFQNVEGLRKLEKWVDFEHPMSFIQPVIERRGGICFHLNYSFCSLLQYLNFRCFLVGCFMKESNLDHMVILVALDKLYLVDVGYGEYFLTQPVPLIDGHIHHDRSGTYRILKVESGRWMVEKQTKRGRWMFKYLVELMPRSLEEFAPTFERQLHPISGFRQNVIYSKWGERGFFRLYNDRITYTRLADQSIYRLNWLNLGKSILNYKS